MPNYLALQDRSLPYCRKQEMKNMTLILPLWNSFEASTPFLKKHQDTDAALFFKRMTWLTGRVVIQHYYQVPFIPISC